MNFGLLFRPESLWVGLHWSPKTRRFCLNIIPMFTIWVSMSDGITPNQGHDIFRTDSV